MRRLMILTVMAVIVLAWAPATLAQPGGCRQEMLRGVWCATCNGFTQLSNVDPTAPKGTLVPFLGILREVINADGKGSGKGVFNIAGTPFPVEMETKFTVSSDCTGEKTYTLKALGLSLPGKATVVYMPHGLEFRIVILVPGDVVSCEYKKMSHSVD